MKEKKLVQDITPSKRRSIRDVSLDRGEDAPRRASSSRASAADRGLRVPVHVEKEKAASEERREERKAPPAARRTKRAGRAEKRWLIIGIAVLCCLAIAYALSIVLARATVTIAPKAETVPIDDSFSASVNAESPNLAFAVLATTTSVQATAPGVPGPVAETYATGPAELFNTTAAPQTIIAGTRLSDDRGLIYKTVSTVSIPAAKASPGGVAVKIIASAPGPSYDSSLDDLSGDLAIVAWKGTARASEFYGRTTGDIAGGASGTTMIVASSTLQSVEASLAARLSANALQAIQAMVPSDSILYAKSVNISIAPAAVTEAGSTTAEISMTASVSGPVFKQADLVNLLAKQEIADFPSNEYSVQGLSALDFALTGPSAFSPAASSIQFSLDGMLTIVGSVDANAIRTAVAGHSLADTGSIFSAYSSVIDNARVSIVPFWVHSIPSSEDRISVIISGSSAASASASR